jgi:hypothetical protein
MAGVGCVAFHQHVGSGMFANFASALDVSFNSTNAFGNRRYGRSNDGGAR